MFQWPGRAMQSDVASTHAKNIDWHMFFSQVQTDQTGATGWAKASQLVIIVQALQIRPLDGEAVLCSEMQQCVYQ